MSNIALDRRILKAFYTQYVAVLLIVLVFGIWTFKSSIDQNPAMTAFSQETPQVLGAETDVSQAAVALPIIPAVGEIEIDDPFEVGAHVSINSSLELEAIAETLLNHDLRAIFQIPVVIKNSDLDQGVEDMQARLAALHAFFDSRGVPELAVTVGTGSSCCNASKVKVSFEFVGRVRELL